MALNSYQLISRVLPGQPFGNGSDGALTVSSNTTQSVANASCSGTSGTTTLTLDSASTFANGNVVLIHQTRGTGVGAWEINRITSGGGGTSLTLQTALASTYTDSSASQAQVFKFPMYSSVTVNSSVAWSAPDWGGNTGGILLFACNGTTTITGSISASYKGYDGAVAGTGSAGTHSGEGTANASLAWPDDGVNGSGGGAGWGGGGGGHANAGSAGTGYSPGLGGYAAGSSDLTTMVFGGGGGSGKTANEYDGAGGAGGGVIICFSKIFTLTGTIDTNGYVGENSPNGSGGGGGAGGAVFIGSQVATLGTTLIATSGGSGGTGVGSPPNYGGAGSSGIIAVHYSSNVTGTTNPTFSQTFDGRLVETSGAIMFF